LKQTPRKKEKRKCKKKKELAKKREERDGIFKDSRILPKHIFRVELQGTGTENPK